MIFRKLLTTIISRNREFLKTKKKIYIKKSLEGKIVDRTHGPVE